jgi:hypothetical protein
MGMESQFIFHLKFFARMKIIMNLIELDWNPFKLISWEDLLWWSVEIVCYICIVAIIIFIIILIRLAMRLKK